MTNKPKQKKTRRRWFGRPTDQPGPQQTFQSEFQVQTPLVDSPQQALRVPEPSPLVESTTHIPVQPLAGPSQYRQGQRRDRGGAPRRGRRHSAGAQETTTATRIGTGAGPLQQRHPSVHRATQSNPTVQAAGGHFSRSRSSSMLAVETSADANQPVAGPSSRPQSLHVAHVPSRPDAVSLASPITHRGPYRQAPFSGLRQYSPPPALSPCLNDVPSTSSLSPSYTHYRHGSNDQSPIDTHPWHFPPTTPHTPSSFRGVSIPPSVQSESSPYLDFLQEDFSPYVEPSEGADVPPLTPEIQPNDPGWDFSGPPSHFELPAAQVRAHPPFRSPQFSQSSVSVPELDIHSDMYFPGNIFGCTQDMLAWSPYSLNNLTTDLMTAAAIAMPEGGTNLEPDVSPSAGPAEAVYLPQAGPTPADA